MKNFNYLLKEEVIKAYQGSKYVSPEKLHIMINQQRKDWNTGNILSLTEEILTL